MRKEAMLLGALGALTLLGSGGKAFAEPTLASIVAGLNPGATHLTPTPELYFKLTGPQAVFEDAYAGYAPYTAFGVYDPSNPANTIQLWSSSVAGNSASLSVATNPFGLYIAESNTGDTFYSQKALNSDNYQHIDVYKSTVANTYYIGFEDTKYGGDGDHNDVVVKVSGVQAIPEPAFYQMGVILAGGGLMALRLRRRNTKG